MSSSFYFNFVYISNDKVVYSECVEVIRCEIKSRSVDRSKYRIPKEDLSTTGKLQ